LRIKEYQVTKWSINSQNLPLDLGHKPCSKVPHTDIFPEIKDSLGKQFSEYLIETVRMTWHLHSLLYQYEISPRPWYYKMPLSRKDIVLINRIRSNHYNLNYNLFRKNMTDSAACHCGDPRQDINHIVFSCPITAPKSRHLRSYIANSFPNQPTDILPILDDPNPKIHKTIVGIFESQFECLLI